MTAQRAPCLPTGCLWDVEEPSCCQSPADAQGHPPGQTDTWQGAQPHPLPMAHAASSCLQCTNCPLSFHVEISSTWTQMTYLLFFPMSGQYLASQHRSLTGTCQQKHRHSLQLKEAPANLFECWKALAKEKYKIITHYSIPQGSTSHIRQYLQLKYI